MRRVLAAKQPTHLHTYPPPVPSCHAAPPTIGALEQHFSAPNSCPASGASSLSAAITTGVCFVNTPSSWIQFGCDAVNVTQSLYLRAGCSGQPLVVNPVIPLGCSPGGDHDPTNGPIVTSCRLSEAGAEAAAPGAVAMGPPQAMPLAEAKAAVAAALQRAVAAAVAAAQGQS